MKNKVMAKVDTVELQESVLFTLIGIEMLLLYAKTLKAFEKQILLRRKMRYLEWLGELYLAEDENDEHILSVHTRIGDKN